MQHNDRLRLIHDLSPAMRDTEDRRCFCRLDANTNPPQVQWEFDQQMYSISRLTREVLHEFNIPVESDHLNGNVFWAKENDPQTLYTVAEMLVKRKKQDENGSVPLF